MDDLKTLVGQLVMVRLFGTELDEDTAAFLAQNRVRGACLFRQNMTDAAQLSRLTADLRAAMGPDALIALDQEGGAVVRSTWVPAPPSWPRSPHPRRRPAAARRRPSSRCGGRSGGRPSRPPGRARGCAPRRRR